MTEEANKPTFPKGVRFRFEEFTSRICDQAKVDYADRPLVNQEWMIRLEELWRTNSESLDTDGATEAALAFWGSPDGIARVYRGGMKGFWHRLLYYERYKIHRQLTLAATCLLHDWIRTSSSVGYTIVSTEDFRYSVVVGNWSYYVGILFIATVILPGPIIAAFPRLKRTIQVIAGALAFCLFWTLSHEWIQSVSSIWRDWVSGGWHRPNVENTPIWKDAVVGVLWSIALLLELFALMAAIPMVISEICDLPSLRRDKLQKAASKT